MVKTNHNIIIYLQKSNYYGWFSYLCPMKLHINSEIQASFPIIKKMTFERIDEEYKSICHFTYKGVYYVIPPQYEVYSVSFKLEDDTEDYHLLSVLEFGKYKGSYKTALKRDIMAKFPNIWKEDEIIRWCDTETEKVLSVCHVV